MEGLILVKNQRSIKVLYLDVQKEIYIRCSDLERVSKHFYYGWERWYYGQECISAAEKAYKGQGAAHYIISEGSYQGLWLRIDMAYLFLRFEVCNQTLLKQVEGGVIKFINQAKSFNKAISGDLSLKNILKTN